MENFKLSGGGLIIEHLQLLKIRYRKRLYLEDTMIFSPFFQKLVSWEESEPKNDTKSF